MRTLARSIVFGIAMLGATASAQNVDPRLGKLDPKTRSAVIAILDSARAASLPTAPLIDKALEGAAKKARGELIVSAVRSFATHLGQARTALGVASSESELIGGAQAIRAGIPVHQLERLRKARPGVQIATALTVVSDLVAREVPMDTALSVVANLVRAAASDDQLLGVRTAIETDIIAGLPPAVAATSQGDALERTLANTGVPNGAAPQGALPSPSGTNRSDPAGGPKPPTQAVGSRGASKPPVQRKSP